MIISDLNYLEVVSEASSLIGGKKRNRSQEQQPIIISAVQNCNTTIGNVAGNVTVGSGGAIGAACTQTVNVSVTS